MAWKPSPFLPTKEQVEIEQAGAQRIIVEANAGVGKTTALCLRALRMMREGADPSRVLMLTFTAPGSEAIRRTLRKHGASAAMCGKLRLGTFDQFCAARLRKVESAPARYVHRPEEVKSFVLSAIEKARDAAQDRYPDDFKLQGAGHLAVEQLLKDFERIKGSMVLQRQGEMFRLTPDTAVDTGFDYTTLAIFMAYEQARLDAGASGDEARFRYVGDATYDLACMLTAEDPVFSHDNHPLRLGELHALFVDEFHDMNWAMAAVLRALVNAYPRLPFTGVGDVDQVIHAASGADSYFLRDGFNAEFGRAERMKLTLAQRFGPAIAMPLAGFADKPYPSHPERQGVMRAVRLDDGLAQALHIERTLQARRLAQPASSDGEVAVLLRHPNAALDLEYELLNRGIDYESAGFTAYMRRPEVLFVRMILASAVGEADAFTADSLAQAKLDTWEFIGGALSCADCSDDPESASKIANSPVDVFQQSMLPHLLDRTPRAQGARCIREAMRLAASNRIETLVSALEALRMQELAGHVFVTVEAIRDARDSVMALERMLQREKFASIAALLRVIRLQEERQQDQVPKRRIVLSTIEQAKGLEFEHVIIPGLDKGGFEGRDEDERHLFYVAVSRARHVVELVHGAGIPSGYIPGQLLT